MLEYLESLFKALSENPVYFAIFGSTVIGVILYICKDLPVKFFKTVLGMLTINVEIYQSTDETAYECVETVLHDIHLNYIVGNFHLVYTYLSGKLNLNCAQSTFFIGKIDGLWCLISKSTDDASKMWHSYSYSLRFFTRDKARVQHFMENLLISYQTSTSSDSIKIYKYLSGYWDSFERPKVDFSCFLPSRQEDILKRVFSLRSQSKLGVLLYGEPGCGKTHLIQMIASVLDRNIYYMNLSEFDNDNDFIKAMLQVRNPAIVLFEDIDCNNGFNRKRVNMKDLMKKKDGASTSVPTGVTLSCLLNVFDGLLTQKNQLIVATTNHIEQLDKALIRSGRFDVSEEITKFSPPEICLFLSSFYHLPVPPNHIRCHISVSDLARICNENSLPEAISLLESKLNVALPPAS